MEPDTKLDRDLFVRFVWCFVIKHKMAPALRVELRHAALTVRNSTIKLDRNKSVVGSTTEDAVVSNSDRAVFIINSAGYTRPAVVFVRS